MRGLEAGVFNGRAYHRRAKLEALNHKFYPEISMEFSKCSESEMPEGIEGFSPDEVWRMVTFTRIHNSYGPLNCYFLYCAASDSFYHMFIVTPLLAGSLTTYNFPMSAGNKAKVTIEKNGDVSPFGVRFSHGPFSHQYYIVVEFDPAEKIFVRVDTLVDGRPQLYTVLKMKRAHRTRPGAHDLIVGSGWAIQIRTYALVLFMFLKFKLHNLGVISLNSAKCIQYYI